MPDLGILGWIIIGLIGGFLWGNVLGQNEASGWLGALVIAVLGAILVLILLRAMRRGD